MPEDNSPQFNIGRGVVKFEPDTTAIDEAITSIEKKFDGLGDKLKTALAMNGVLDELENRVERITQRISTVAVPEVREPEPVRVREPGSDIPPPFPFDINKEMENAKNDRLPAEANVLLTEIRDLMQQLILVRTSE